MSTKAELEDKVDALAGRLDEAEDAVTELLELVRDAHDEQHSDPWTICRSTLCREAFDIDAALQHRQFWAAS